ncbi:microtubule-associated protein Jupiter-like isoform X2 [Limulus polyphemus]|uniref:Microtubule-associated protein Jupiter n=1 Tax=Limulus polyphemus TaxID=6850 RepID=A0ABM1BGR9_LIMPO|nr:microtubule-associated protein Jupiter-like isoform X2 [Limulus polyphemus]
MTSTNFSVGFGNEDKSSSKVTKPPGGQSSDIFGTGNDNEDHKPRRVKNYMHSSIFEAGDASTNVYTTQGGASEGSMFGSDVTDTTPRKVVDRMKSNVFDGPGQISKPSSAKKYGPVRRNPITGEVYDDTANVNGHANRTESPNPVTGSGDPGCPVQPCVRVRNPPGGKSSGIF